MNQKIFKIRNGIFKTAKKFWDKIILILVVFLILDVIIAGFSFSNCCRCQLDECGVYFPMLINRNLADNFSDELIKRTIEFKNVPQKQYRDLFNIAVQQEEPESESEF